MLILKLECVGQSCLIMITLVWCQTCTSPFRKKVRRTGRIKKTNQRQTFSTLREPYKEDVLTDYVSTSYIEFARRESSESIVFVNSIEDSDIGENSQAILLKDFASSNMLK